jgi:hypothetical protein
MYTELETVAGYDNMSVDEFVQEVLEKWLERHRERSEWFEKVPGWYVTCVKGTIKD